MMKQLLLTTSLVTFGVLGGVGIAHAGSGPGCSWGQMVFKGQSNPSPIPP